MSASSHQRTIIAAASQFGWTMDAGWESRMLMVLTKPGPMIDRKPTDRIVLKFTIGGRLLDAYYGTDQAPTNFARPLLSSVLGMITR